MSDPTPRIVTVSVRHAGQPVMARPLQYTYRADLEADAVERLQRAGMEVVPEGEGSP
jgi:hypothetical protein